MKKQPWYTSLNLPAWSLKNGRHRKTSSTSHGGTANRADQSTGAGGNTYTGPAAFTVTDVTATIKHPTIPHAGIRAGEIIGYRYWYVIHNDQLCSVAHYFIWKPEVTVEGNLDEVVCPMILRDPIFGGVYSYSNKVKIDFDLGIIRLNDFPIACDFKNRKGVVIRGVAIGTIKCWGEVVEHECGYRAQYAKIATIDYVVGKIDINSLRERYRVP